MNITVLSERELRLVIEMREPRGLFISDGGKPVVGVDNRTGDAWTEEFYTREECQRWLMGESKGYHDAAKLIEQLANSLRSEIEMDWMKRFVRENCFEEEACRDQLRALWTAYCLHHDYNVDTFEYDCNLDELWKAVAEIEPETADWSDYGSFENYMCDLLV